jgi:PAS domain-containing protein
MYFVEIPFRIVSTVNLMIFSRWAISLNPPPWEWATGATNVVPRNFSLFVSVKQACVALILLLAADVFLNIRFVRSFFRLEPVVDQRRTGYVVSIFLLIGCLFWLLDSLLHGFAHEAHRTFIDFLALDIPPSNLLTRLFFLVACMTSGMVTAKILQRQKQGEIALLRAKEEAVIGKTFLQELIRAIPDLVWLKNQEGVYLACNSRYESYLGVKETEIIGIVEHPEITYIIPKTRIRFSHIPLERDFSNRATCLV